MYIPTLKFKAVILKEQQPDVKFSGIVMQQQTLQYTSPPSSLEQVDNFTS